MSIFSMLLPVDSGQGVLACLMLLTFFPNIFAITLRGLGRHTKLVATGLTTATSGGAVWTSVTWIVQRDHNGDARYAMRVYVILHGAMLAIVGIINLHPTIRRWVDAEGTRSGPAQIGRPGV
jgi:fucose permease